MSLKKVQTVLGDVNPNDLGMTLTHEHLSMDFSFMYVDPPEHQRHMLHAPFTLPNLGWIRRNPFSHPYNLKLNDDESKMAVIDEMRLFKSIGGGTIVENTTAGLGRDIPFLRKVAQDTNVNVIAGAGFYIARAQSDSVKVKSVEQISEILRNEMTSTTDGHKVKCGFLGELASIHPIENFENKVLQSAGIIQNELGCGVMIHPHRVKEAPYDALRVYLEAGGKADKLVMAHMDRTLLDVESLLDFSKMGCLLEFDMFGIECSHYQLHEPTDMPSDAQRIQQLKCLINEGLEDRIVLAHDIYAKHRLMAYGGHGYSHLFTNLIPKMLSRGIPQNIIDKFFIANPANWLAF